MSLVHFVQGPSAAGSIRMALDELERNELVVYLGDDLSFGPINPPTPSRRAAWCRTRHVDAWWSQRSVARFWQAAVSPSIEPVMWLSRRAVAEYTCLLELVWCRRQAPLVIDVADIALLNNTSISIGFVRHERMIEHAFLERARRLLASEVDAMRTAWHWQRAENSELRILAESGVRSVPLSHFDALIVSIAGDLWTPCAQVLVNTIESPGSAFRQLGQELVWSRIRFLVDNGQLEGNDEFGPLHTSLVRRPPRSRRRGR